MPMKSYLDDMVAANAIKSVITVIVFQSHLIINHQLQLNVKLYQQKVKIYKQKKK
jgi:hypothetical protein